MTDDQKVEVASKDGISYTVVGGSDSGPWWVKYSMQAGFMFVLILVLWGCYDLIKNELPSLVKPANDIVEAMELLNLETAKATTAKVQEAKAAEKQADAIDRWVNQQSYRITNSTPGLYGPPLLTRDP